MRGKRFAEKAGMGAHPYWEPWLCSAGMPFPEKQRRPIHRVHQDSPSSPGWPGTSRHDLCTEQKRSTKAADCHLCARRVMVGRALAALPPIVMEIDGVASAHSRTYRNIVSAVDVLCADRMPLFTKKFSFNGCFQQGPRRSGEPLRNRHNRRW